MKAIHFKRTLAVFAILSLISLFASVSASKELSYKVNRNNQTYGSLALAAQLQEEPDLILATGSNGENGYVYRTDLEGPEPASPEEALDLQRQFYKSGGEGSYIPLYEADGRTVIGQFYISPAQTSSSDPIMTRGSTWGSSYDVTTPTGHTYFIRSRIDDATAGMRGYACIGTKNETYAPAGYMGAQGRVLGAGDGAVKATARMTYTQINSKYYESSVFWGTVYGTYYAQGLTKEWTGNGYWTHLTNKTPNRNT